MAIVNLSTVWVTDVATGQSLALLAASELSRGQSTEVIRQRTASGRMRAIVTPNRDRVWTLDPDGVTLRELDWLRAHEARLCCFRDPLGGRVFGMYSAVEDSRVGTNNSGWRKVTLEIFAVTRDGRI